VISKLKTTDLFSCLPFWRPMYWKSPPPPRSLPRRPHRFLNQPAIPVRWATKRQPQVAYALPSRAVSYPAYPGTRLPLPGIKCPPRRRPLIARSMQRRTTRVEDVPSARPTLPPGAMPSSKQFQRHVAARHELARRFHAVHRATDLRTPSSGSTAWGRQRWAAPSIPSRGVSAEDALRASRFLASGGETDLDVTPRIRYSRFGKPLNGNWTLHPTHMVVSEACGESGFKMIQGLLFCCFSCPQMPGGLEML
jgi:hypothetical protein